METPADIDQYLASVPAEMRAPLSELHRMILRIVPGATETISYGMPAFKYRGKPLIYFAAWKTHCAIYGTAAGTVQFPPSEPLTEPYLRTLLEERLKSIDAPAPRRPRSNPAGSPG